MLNNNKCSYIGSTHSFKYITSNDLINTSNNLINNIIYNSNIIENDIINTSNNLISYTNNTSNNLINYTNYTSNKILERYDKLIKEEKEDIILPIPATLNHTYIYNSNLAGEIRFWCKSTSEFPVIIPVGVPDYRVKIDVDGKLKVYYTYDPAINLTFGNGWIDVGNSIVGLNASDVNIGITISGLEAQILLFNNKFNEFAKDIAQEFQMRFDLESEEYELLLNNLRNSGYYTTSGYIGEFSTFTNGILQTIRTGNFKFLNTALTNIALIIAQNPVVSFFLGIGGIGFAAAATAIQDLAYLEVLVSQVQNQISINSNLTSNQKNELYSSNNNLRILKTISYCSNVSNLTLYQGFINSNMTAQQYIPSLRCDNLDLNTGNISGINYVNVNNIVADGKIKENNKFLDATYLTSNHLYNLAYGYSSEREYPPKTFTTATPETTTTFLNKLVYKQTLFLDTNFITHGNGYYEIYSSSTYDIDTPKSLLFNHNTSDLKNARWFINLYEFGTGLYLGDNSIDGSYYGDWVIIKLPQPIVLTKFRFYTGGAVNSSPGTWKCYGSTDGLIFTEITEGSQTTSITTANYSSGFYEKSLNPSFTTLYQYFGFVVNKLVSINSFRELRFGELRLYGKEVISNSITSSIYTTSNVCKNLIIYDTPQVYKRSAFYCFTDEVIYPNGGSTPYYTHHIDLRLYTKTGYTVQNDPYRIFKIKCFFETSYFQKLTNGTPDICEYSIHMSSKAAAGGEGSIAGINIMAIGTPQNYFLNNIMNNNLFILRNANNNFNYLSIVSTQNSDVRVFITDELN